MKPKFYSKRDKLDKYKIMTPLKYKTPRFPLRMAHIPKGFN